MRNAAFLFCASVLLSSCGMRPFLVFGDAELDDAEPEDPDARMVDFTIPPPTPTWIDGSTPASRSGENCNTPFDDNGNGVVNEDCPCQPETVQRCFPAEESLFRGMCRMGRQRCGPQEGVSGQWGVCEGAWPPISWRGNVCEITARWPTGTTRGAALDVVWVIDSSGSMATELNYVNNNLNEFARELAAAGHDYRITVVADRGTGPFQICIPPPLGGSNCGDSTRFRHINQQVGSTDGLQQLLNTRGQWSGFLRSNARKIIVAVTDDDSALSAERFDQAVRGWIGFNDYLFVSIVGYENTSDCPTLARRGSQYLLLTERTGGSRARVCDPDWDVMFRALAQSITTAASTLTLSEIAREDTVQLWRVDPPATRTQLFTDWTFDARRNQVTINTSLVPPSPSWLEVRYRPLSISP